MKKYDCIIIGSGAIGWSVQYYLAQQGLTSLTLEQFNFGHSKGSTHGQTRAFRFGYYEQEKYLPLILSAYKYWDQLQAESNLPIFKKTGVLEIYNKDEIDIENALSISKKYNFLLEVIDNKSLISRYNYFNLSNDMVGLYEPNSGFLDIELVRQAFYRSQMFKGNYFHQNEKVVDWQVVNNSQVVVTTNKNEYQSTYLVISPGSWYQIIKYNLIDKIKLIRKVLCWFDLIKTENTYAEKDMPVFGFAQKQEFYYGFPPYQGQIKIARHTGNNIIENPEDLDLDINAEEKDAIIEFALKYIKNINVSSVKFSQCIYSLTKDENFIIDKHPNFKNIVIALGLSGHGYKFSPVIAEIIIKLLMGEKIDYEVDFLSLKRF